MAEPRIFYLRSDAFEDKKRRYLSHVSADGLKASWNSEPRNSYAFTDYQRNQFVEKNPHIKGRWVLMRRELARISALKGGK